MVDIMAKIIEIKYKIKDLQTMLKRLEAEEKAMATNCHTKDWFRIMNKIRKVKKMIQEKRSKKW